MDTTDTLTNGLQFTLTTDDGVALSAAVHEPHGDARANVLILGATAVPRAFYDRFSAHLAAHGLRVLSFDYRGVGRSRRGSLRGDRSTMTDWATRDARAALAYLCERHPALPTILVGHSFGGQALGICDALGDVDAAVLVGSQLGSWRHWPGARGLVLAAWWRVIPIVARAVGWLPGWMGLTHDLPAGVATEWARWCDHPEYLIGHVEGAAARFGRVRAPVLAYSFTDDDYAPRAAVEALLGRLSGARVFHRRIAPSEVGVREVGHFGFFRPGAGAVLWGELTGFIDDVLSGRSPRVAATVRAQEEARGFGIAESDVMADLAVGRD